MDFNVIKADIERRINWLKEWEPHHDVVYDAFVRAGTKMKILKERITAQYDYRSNELQKAHDAINELVELSEHKTFVDITGTGFFSKANSLQGLAGTPWFQKRMQLSIENLRLIVRESVNDIMQRKTDAEYAALSYPLIVEFSETLSDDDLMQAYLPRNANGSFVSFSNANDAMLFKLAM